MIFTLNEYYNITSIIKSKKYELITVLGPTASGKTSFAVNLASHINAEIISADSRQVYRDMNIGTGKDLEKYHLNGKDITYHLIDICNPGEKYNVFRFHQDFYRIFNFLKMNKKFPILCGGTGLYIESVLKGYNFQDIPKNCALRFLLKKKDINELKKILQYYKKEYNLHNINSFQKIIREIEIFYFSIDKPLNYFPINTLIIGININRQKRREQIKLRLKTRLKNGMVEEVKNLLNRGVTSKELIYYGLEYKYITLYLIGQISYSEMYEKLKIAIYQFAKRQMTWFRGMERRGFKIYWIND